MHMLIPPLVTIRSDESLYNSPVVNKDLRILFKILTATLIDHNEVSFAVAITLEDVVHHIVFIDRTLTFTGSSIRS